MRRSFLKLPRGNGKEEAIREEIVRRAAALFERRGFRATSVQDIVDEVGISKPTFYTYLHSKNDILAQIFETIDSEARRAAGSIVAADISAAEKLHALIRSHLRLLVDRRGFYAVYFQEKAELPRKLRLRLKAGEHAYHKTMEEVFRQGAEDASLPPLDPKVAALGVIGMCNWVYRWYHETGPLGLDEIADDLFQIVAGRKTPMPSPGAARGPDDPAAEQ